MHKLTMGETVGTIPGFQDRRMPRLRTNRGSGARAVRERTGPKEHVIQALSIRPMADPRSMPMVVGPAGSARCHRDGVTSET